MIGFVDPPAPLRKFIEDYTDDELAHNLRWTMQRVALDHEHEETYLRKLVAESRRREVAPAAPKFSG